MLDVQHIAIVLGLLVIALRGPLIFAPEATVSFYRNLLVTQTRARVLGLVVGVLGLGLLASTASAQGVVENVLVAVGWLMTLGGVFVLLVPRVCMRVWSGILEFAESGTDPAILRGIGLVSVALGALLIYWALALA